jgi:hypothetical protein
MPIQLAVAQVPQVACAVAFSAHRQAKIKAISFISLCVYKDSIYDKFLFICLLNKFNAFKGDRKPPQILQQIIIVRHQDAMHCVSTRFVIQQESLCIFVSTRDSY